MSSKNISYLGILTALALIISYFERIVPTFVPVPGIKLGLANIIVIITLYLINSKQAFFLSIARTLLVAILFGGLSSFIYSLSGGLLSFSFMILFKRFKGFSIIGVSVIGGVTHNIAQIIVATYVVSNLKLLYYLPILIFSGIISGTLIGIISFYTLKNLCPLNTTYTQKSSKL